MATLETIASAIKQIDTKKDDLKKAYDDLQSNSSILSSCSLSWSDLDAHFTQIQNSLTHRFRLLESLQSTHSSSTQFDKPTDSPSDPIKDPSLSTPVLSQGRVGTFVTRSELWTLCEKMDGRGLIKYINNHSKDRESIRVELGDAFRSSPDPGMMVLDAMEEVLMGIDVNIDNAVKEKAKKLAFEWKGKVRMDRESGLEAFGFLHLVGTYGLGSEFEKNDLVEYLLLAAWYRQVTLLCKAVGLGDKVQDLIQKLIDSGKQLLAIKYIFEFELTDKYPPVPLLEAYVNETKKLAENLCREKKNTPGAQNEAVFKEVNALKAVIKVVEDYKLESECPKETFEKRIEQLEKQKADRKRPSPAAKPQQQPKKLQQNANKRPRTAAALSHAPGVAGANSTVPPFRQPRVHPSSLPENSALYLNSAAGPFGFMDSTPAIAAYAAPHIASGYYDRSTAYVRYGLPPQYHPSYYPQ
ncbi:hypothetical protein QYF36_006696 [Acer negundo]|nr:hypothetical protein QYF36_006696 [Acer negundo]